MARPLQVGLTGGLACGKTTVLREWVKLGAGAIDGDELARRALDRGSPLLPAVARLLGPGALTAAGTLDRGAVAARVFRDPALRHRLEALVHPEVLRGQQEESARLEASGYRIIVFDAALLFEAGAASRFDRVVVVSCPEALQIERAVTRGMSAEDARARIASQMPVADKASRADYVIDSSGTMEETLEAARRVWELLRGEQERR